jgi:hypothetical protein
MEERVTGEDPFTVGEQPPMQISLLIEGGVELMPCVGSSTRGPEPGESELGSESIGKGKKVVKLGHVVAGNHDRNLELSEISCCEVFHGASSGREGACSSDAVVGDLVGAIDADLDIEVLHAGELCGSGCIDESAIG